MAPREAEQIPPSDASTIAWDTSVNHAHPLHMQTEHNQADDTDRTYQNTEDDTVFEEGGEVVSDIDSISDLGEGEDEIGPNHPMRDDIPIETGRWRPEETDALMTALNVNRDAIKFHFDGPGGGKEVKRQAWRDVAGKSFFNNCTIPVYKI